MVIIVYILHVCLGRLGNYGLVDQNLSRNQADRFEIVDQTEKMLFESLEKGDSVLGKLEEYLNKDTRISVAAQIENYSRWPLYFYGYTRKTGRFGLVPRHVLNGTFERWMSQKKFGLFGNQMQLKFFIRHITEVHVMYDAPYNFNFYSNILSTIICDHQDEMQLGDNFSSKKVFEDIRGIPYDHSPSNNTSCPDELFGARGPHIMYDHHGKCMNMFFLIFEILVLICHILVNGLRRHFYRKMDDAYKMVNSNDLFLLQSQMTAGHHAMISIKLFPITFDDLAPSQRSTTNQTIYDAFVNSLLSK